MASTLKARARAAGLVLVAIAPSLLIWPAAAQNFTQDEKLLPPPCQKLGPTKAGVDCALKELDRRINDAKARAKAAEEQAAAADADAAASREQDACGQYLLKGVADRKWMQPEILAEAGGKFTPQNVCEIARRHGYVRKPPPAGAPRSPK
jgi:hypothetical protein